MAAFAALKHACVILYHSYQGFQTRPWRTERSYREFENRMSQKCVFHTREAWKKKKLCLVKIICLASAFAYDVEFVYLNLRR